ncbi:MAG: ATP-binding protein [Leptospirales bacterium]|nr:ATP-binding protein [Leptospirales bacterium]
MKKRIYLSMGLLVIAVIILVSLALSFVFYKQFVAVAKNEIKDRARQLRNIPFERLSGELSKIHDMRVSVIKPDGEVIYDNTAAVETLPNHIDREEISKASRLGFGESKRFSSTLSEETYYYAVKLPDAHILRIAKTSGSVFFVFKRALPTVCLIAFAAIIMGYFAAGNLTRRIVMPINKACLEGEIIPPYDELAPFARAIAEYKKQAETAFADLQDRSNTIETIMENMNEGLVLINHKGTILSANKSALKIFGATSAMEGKNVLELLRDLILLEYIRNALAGSRGETSIERDGRDYSVYFSPVTSGGTLMFLLDVTEKMKTEKLRREFSANVSHELKTPLTSISGYMEMLANDIVKEADKASFIKKMREELGRLISLVENIMLISRLDDGVRPDIVFEDLDIAEIANEVAETLALKAGDLKVSINVKGENIFVRANRPMMTELFSNLIDNAVKYNKPDGSVTVSFAKNDERILLAVSDTGIGIPKEEQGRVFERFYRVDKSRSKKTGGTGLGLAIVKHIAIVHNASIDLESREEVGTTITVAF